MFSQEDVRKIAKLSSLELTDTEVEAFSQQFTNILDYFERLKAVNVEESTQDRDENHLQIFREDRTEESLVSPDQFSPYLEGKLFKVPRVIDQG